MSGNNGECTEAPSYELAVGELQAVLTRIIHPQKCWLSLNPNETQRHLLQFKHRPQVQELCVPFICLELCAPVPPGQWGIQLQP